MVKKLLQQRSKTQDLGDRHRFSGRKAKLLQIYRERLEKLVAAEPDLTLAQIKARLSMSCTVPALHYALLALGLTYKKTLHAAEQNRPDVAATRQQWKSE